MRTRTCAQTSISEIAAGGEEERTFASKAIPIIVRKRIPATERMEQHEASPVPTSGFIGFILAAIERKVGENKR